MTEKRPNGETNPADPDERPEETAEAGTAREAAAADEDGTAREAAAADEDGTTVATELTDEPNVSQRLRAERDRSRDQHLRLAADFDNYRKRTEDRLRQRWNSARADLVSHLLDPLDDLLRVTALEPETASVEAIVEGVDLVERKFFRVLEDAGVEIVDPGGEVFDPNTMEAMMRVPADSEDDDEVVAQVFQRGYTLKGLLVRPARVSVYKA